MTDNHTDEPATIDDHDFALPVTDAFIRGVHRGVRRRRVLRAIAGSGAAIATAGIAAFLFTLAGSADRDSPPNSAASSVAAASPTPASDPIPQALDGYRVTFVPEGLKVGAPANGSASYPVSKNQLHNDGSAPASPHPTATTTMRIYVKPNGSNWLDVTVLRPQRTTADADKGQVTAWLTGWALKGNEVIEKYDVPAGHAQVTRFVGSEVTVHTVVITTPDGAVIVVGGNGHVPVADLTAVAAGLLPQ